MLARCESDDGAIAVGGNACDAGTVHYVHAELLEFVFGLFACLLMARRSVGRS